MSFSRRIGTLSPSISRRALIGVGDDAGSDDDPFVRLEFDFQGHACSPSPLGAIVVGRISAPEYPLVLLQAIRMRSFPIVVNDW